MDGQAVVFGPFRLLAAERLLLEGDQPVRLGSRAFDILATLLQRPGEVIGKDELISLTWPNLCRRRQPEDPDQRLTPGPWRWPRRPPLHRYHSRTGFEFR